jgi:sarcosine oxidase delta subunit
MASEPREARAIWRLIVFCEAYRAGIDPEYVFKLRNADRRTANKHWRAANGCRRMATYIAHTMFGITYSELAEICGISRAAVSQIVHDIEDRREDPKFDGWLSDVQRAVNG